MKIPTTVYFLILFAVLTLILTLFAPPKANAGFVSGVVVGSMLSDNSGADKKPSTLLMAPENDIITCIPPSENRSYLCDVRGFLNEK